MDEKRGRVDAINQVRKLLDTMRFSKSVFTNQYNEVYDWISPYMGRFYDEFSDRYYEHNSVRNANIDDNTAEVELERLSSFLTSVMFPVDTPFLAFSTGNAVEDKDVEVQEQLIKLQRLVHKKTLDSNLRAVAKTLIQDYLSVGFFAPMVAKKDDQLKFVRVHPKRLFYMTDDYGEANVMMIYSWKTANQLNTQYGYKPKNLEQVEKEYAVFDLYTQNSGVNLEELFPEMEINNKSWYKFTVVRYSDLETPDKPADEIFDVIGDKPVEYKYKPFFIGKAPCTTDGEYPVSSVCIKALPVVKRLQAYQKDRKIGSTRNCRPSIVYPVRGIQVSNPRKELKASGVMIPYDDSRVKSDAIRPISQTIEVQSTTAIVSELQYQIKQIFMSDARTYNDKGTQARSAEAVKEGSTEKNALIAPLVQELADQLIIPLTGVILGLLKGIEGFEAIEEYSDIRFSSPMGAIMNVNKIQNLEVAFRALTPVFQIEPELLLTRVKLGSIPEEVFKALNLHDLIADNEEFEQQKKQLQEKRDLDKAQALSQSGANLSQAITATGKENKGGI